METFELRGDGVLLSAPSVDDVPRITAICQDTELQRWTAVPVPYTENDAASFVTDYALPAWEAGTELTWAVRDPEERRVLGMIGVKREGGNGQLGFWLASDARGQRVMSRAVRLVAEYSFSPDGLALSHLIWWAFVGNWDSRRVAWATGFRIEGTVRGGQTQRGQAVDSWVGSLRAGDPMQPATRWLNIPVLNGDGLTLRPWRPDDADAMVEGCSDPRTRYWLSNLSLPYGQEQALAYIQDTWVSAADGTAVNWAITLADDESLPVGAVSVVRIRMGRPAFATIGYWSHPAVRGSGVMSRALGLAVRHAFAATESGGLGLDRLELGRAEGNDASAHVAETNGFRHIGRVRAAEPLGDGTLVDLHRYDLLPSDLLPSDLHG
ncbi:MAG TPA: GNAT family N-acetyltransferase [Jiangellaceae bacterium]|nr:GNAT family N-acetyltransferase [Jiangellaceae bacterium]